MLELWGGDE
jgi:CubicO group peptidase (beta-lactamase class C family)